MKRSEAANRLAEFLAELLNKHPLDSEGGFKILPILDFLENEIGMTSCWDPEEMPQEDIEARDKEIQRKLESWDKYFGMKSQQSRLWLDSLPKNKPESK